MPAVQRVGDQDDAPGGAIINGVGSVLVNGIPVAVTGASVTAHNNYKGAHVSATTQNSQGSVTAGGQPIVITGDVDSCGHTRQGGSPNVNIG
jgi:uncharacterized Zn-binding protein involved in type VI secretion